ncbi:hypothetical protein ACFX13_036346 [Malus domestica]
MYMTRLEMGAFVDIEISVPEESRKCSSFFVHRSSKIKPQRPLDQQSSTFKIKPRRPLKKAFFIPRSSFFQDQAPTALWINNHPPIQDQAPTALEESVLRSSFIVLPRSSPDGPWINHPPIQDQAPTALEESTIVHHPFIQDQAPTAIWINNVDKSTHPTVLQDQAQKPLKIRSSLFFEIKPKGPRRSVQAQKLSKIRSSLFFEFKPKSPRKSVHHCSSRSSPKALEDPLITILQDQAQKPLKIRSSSFIQDQASTALGSIAHPTNQHLTEIESEDQNRERL